MRLIISIALSIIILHSFGQNFEEFGIDNDPKLSYDEAMFLNEYLKNQRDTFDLIEKQIIFVTGSNAGKLGNKKEYFSAIKEWENKENLRISTTLIILTEKERIESGGYDAIITYWVKVFPDIKKTIEMIKTSR